MCGIAGAFDLNGKRDLSLDLLERMNASQFHRGPDEGAVWREPGVGLAHRRLSIIDVATGQQPMFNEDGSVAVVFNGEIYNFGDLVPELERAGHRFATRSDTEVILHAWEEWGEKSVERFRGMFAFAVYDRNRQCLFLARDRLGVKPLYYTLTADGLLLFGSELKALLAHRSLTLGLDESAVEDYFALGYVPEPKTIYRGVHKLCPGHVLVCSRGSNVLNQKRYWDVVFTATTGGDEADLLAELRARLAESVRLRMISEVPLGAFLSGGVDSSAVVATMAGLDPQPVNTCAISFADPAFDEARYAQSVADRYRTRHFVERVETDDFELIDELARLYDEPYADSSAIPTYRVCQLARRHVTVALSGDGGDESFGGYRRYRLHLAEERMRGLLPLGVRRPVFGALGAIYPKADWAPRVVRAKSTFQALARDAVEAYFHSVSIVRDADRGRLFSPSFKRSLGGYRAVEVFREHAQRAECDDPLSLIQYLDLKTYLVGDINTKVDRASMAHSLEVREPLMDHPLVEWLASLEPRWKVRGGEGKYLLKKAMEPALPREILYRPKMGFAVPLARWFRGPLRERVTRSLTEGVLQDSGYFEAATIRQMIDAHVSGMRDHSAPLWTLLMFESFLRQSPLAGSTPEKSFERAEPLSVEA